METKQKEIDHFRILSVDYIYRGEAYVPDKTHTGRGRKFNKIGSNDSLIITSGNLHKNGIEVIRHCYPVFKK